jgi:hypothetical protein
MFWEKRPKLEQLIDLIYMCQTNRELNEIRDKYGHRAHILFHMAVIARRLEIAITNLEERVTAIERDKQK